MEADMKKTIFLAVALSLLLCATAVAGNLGKLVSHQKVILNSHLVDYPTGQTVRTRAEFRNIDITNDITIDSITFYDPNGDKVDFCVSDTANGPCDELIGRLVGTPGDTSISLKPFQNASVMVAPNDLVDASWNNSTPPDFEGGGPMYLIEWSSTAPVVPPEIWGLGFSIYGGGKNEDKYRIRYSYDRWEGIVIEETP